MKKNRSEIIRMLLWSTVVLAAVVLPASEIEFVTVGDAGNAPYFDGYSGYLIQGPVGSVAHVYRLGKYEITQEQYLEFLNAVDPQGSNALGLFHASTPPLYGDPSFDGCDYILDLNQPEGQRYSLRDVNGATVPVWGATWYAAARYCNWLHNGKGGPGSTEGTDTDGAYDTRNFNDGISTNDPPTHNPGAKCWLPTFDEWFKAAFYKGGGTHAGYWTNPFQHDGEPLGGFPTNDSNTANIYDRTQSPKPPSPGRRVPVGSYPFALSPYGCLDMGGNGNEWSERVETNYAGVITRRVMGGFFGWYTDHLTLYAQLNFSTHQHPPTDWWNGFRIVARDDPDIDEDEMPDVWETANGLDPWNAGDAHADSDGDGMSNRAEYVAGTDPRNRASRFELMAPVTRSDRFCLEFQSVTGRLYDVQYRADLAEPGDWAVLTGGLAGTGQVVEFRDAPTMPKRFYRIAVREP